LVQAADVPHSAVPESTTVRELLTGTWGFSADSGGCADKPHTIRFSADGSEMFLRYQDPPGEGAYQVRSAGPGHLRLAMRDESQRTAAGALVEWDLILVEPGAYTWHRTDWDAHLRTWPVRRCVSDTN
jgi:hypothetical protein